MSASPQRSDGRQRIEDAGVVLPHARKHGAAPTGPEVSVGTPRLADLFPEPDWAAALRRGMAPACAAYLAMLYDSLATAPKADGIFKLTADEWSSAYLTAVRLIRQFFEEVQTLEEAKTLAQWFARHYGETPRSIVNRPIRDVAPYWAAAPGGRRRMRSPGSFTTRQHLLSIYMPMLGWPESKDVLKTNVVPCELEDGTWRAVQIKGDSLIYVSGAIATLQDALHECERESHRMLGTSAALRSRRSASIQPRSGPDVRFGRDISGDDLMREFGFRGVQWGESVPQSERQSLLNEGWDALCDLAEILCIPRRWIALGAGDDALGIAFGARGVARALAHYEPALNIINLTRLRGRGCLAHEWFHSADRRAGRRHGADSYMEIAWRMPCEGLQGIEPQLQGLYSALRTSELRKQARRIEALPQAQKYWSTMCELGARAFESWVQDSLVLDGRYSPLLVHGTLEKDHMQHPDESPYPRGAERFQLGEHFEGLVVALRAMANASTPAPGQQMRLPGFKGA